MIENMIVGPLHIYSYRLVKSELNNPLRLLRDTEIDAISTNRELMDYVASAISSNCCLDC